MNPDGFKKEGLLLTREPSDHAEAREIWSVRAAGSGRGIPYAWGTSPEGAVSKLLETVKTFAKGVHDCISKPVIVPEHNDDDWG